MELTIAFAEKPQPPTVIASPTGAKQSPTSESEIASAQESRLAMTQSNAFVFDLILDGQSHLRDIPFVDPLTEKDLRELRWYLEEYLDWPYSEPVRKRAQKIERQLDEWGAALFDAVFARPEARVLCDRLLESKDDARFVTIQSPDARILRLPWELLRDRSGPLITAGISIRRHVEQGVTPAVPQFALPLRVLYVIARPIDAGFIDPRSSAGGVMDALAPLIEKGWVTVDFVRPPTFEQLSRMLERGTYHLFHFDGHGFYEDKLGLGGLAFEDAAHKTHLVTARELGDLLNRRGIALAILDACRTGREIEAKAFSSVAAQLITSGVGSVVCMSYSVYVTAATIFTRRFYESLVNGQTVGAATRAGRESLMTSPNRSSSPDEKRDLKDWFLPLLYQRGKDVVAVGGAMELRHYEPSRHYESSRVYGFPPAPRYGFTGRSRELLQVERALLDHRVVVLYGFGGIGKTALAREASLWLTRTGMFDGGAVFLSFENGADEDQAILAIGNFIEGAAFNQKSPQERLEFVEAYLKEHPTLVVWDNFESVFDDAVTAPALRAGILRLGARWAELFSAGTPRRSSLLITSRQEEIEIPLAAKVELGGFSHRDALDFAAAILGKEGIDRAQLDPDALGRLMELLGNHALSLALVLPKLKTMPIGKMLDEFEELLPGFKTGEGKKRDESLQVSLDFSLRRLGEETRRLLPALAVFQGGAHEALLLQVTGFKFDVWQNARTELERAALISIDRDERATLQLKVGNHPITQSPIHQITHYLKFHPTLAPHLARLLAPATRAELETRYREAYYQFARFLVQADSKTPIQARALAVREMPNLKRALALTLAAGDVASVHRSSKMDTGEVTEGERLRATAVDFADSIVWFLDYFGRWRERDAVMEQVDKETRRRGDKGTGKLTKAEFLLESRRGETLLDQGRAAEAERVFRALLARMPSPPAPLHPHPSPPPRAGEGTGEGSEVGGYERCVTLGRLGRSLEAQGKPSAAAEAYRDALELADKLEQDDDVRRMIGRRHTDLADVLTELARYDEAREHYETSLKIKATLTGEERGKAVVLGQLGTLALVQGELAEARQRYTDALIAFRNLGEPQGEAIFWHQLGMVAEEARDWDEAERCYKESLAIEERLGHKEGAAQTCNQLAIVAEGAGRLEDAERWYKRAIELGEEVGDRQGLAKRYNNLANLLLSQNRLEEAEAYAHRAREIKETLDLSSQPWTTYEILAEIAEKRGRAEEAREWRRKRDEARRAFAEQSGGQWKG
jgi:tetratricopeptide (TPR) repeat protein